MYTLSNVIMRHTHNHELMMMITVTGLCNMILPLECISGHLHLCVGSQELTIVASTVTSSSVGFPVHVRMCVYMHLCGCANERSRDGPLLLMTANGGGRGGPLPLMAANVSVIHWKWLVPLAMKFC